MGFASYILDALKQHGSVHAGPLGSFYLDYQPAKWQINKLNFLPPQAKLRWEASKADSTYDYGILASTIALKHDILFQEAMAFVVESIQQMTSTPAEKITLGSIGYLQKGVNREYFESFIINPKLEETLQFTPVALQPLYAAPLPEKMNWWLAIASAVLLALLYLTIGTWYDKKGYAITSKTASTNKPFLSNSTIKELNSPPVYVSPDSIKNNEALQNTIDSTKDVIMEELSGFIIITGTFCEAKNLRRAKEKIVQEGYILYEQKMNAKCTRIGIRFNEHDPYLTLEKIRNTIEPEAWLLEE